MNIFEFTQEERLESVIDAIIYELDQQDVTGIYIQKLGLLTVTFEAYHYDKYTEEFLQFQENDYRPKVVTKGLQYALDEYLSRRAFPNGRTSHKIAVHSEDDPEFEHQYIVEEVVSDSNELSARTVKKSLKNSSDEFYWTD